MVDDCSKITASCYSEKRKRDIEGTHPTVVALLFFSTLILFVFFFLVYYGITEDSDMMLVMAYILLGLSMTISIGVGIHNWRANPDTKSLTYN